MNILVRNANGKVFFRPDTTCDRPGEDLYPQEFIASMSFAPVVYMRVCKAGRSVSERFAGRYFNSAGYGLFLYPDDLLDGSEESVACASCIDHTSFLPAPVEGSGRFSLSCDGEEIFAVEGFPLEDMRKALAEVTSRVHIRTGDLIALELCKPSRLCSRPCRKEIKGVFNSDTIIDFKIIMNEL